MLLEVNVHVHKHQGEGGNETLINPFYSTLVIEELSIGHH